MKANHSILLFIVLTAANLFCGVAFCREPPPSFDALLNQVGKMVDADRQTNRLREEEFLRTRDQQQSLLKQAKEKSKLLQAQSTAEEEQFQKNEIELAKLESIHIQRVGDFTELSALLGQFSTGLRAQLTDSIVSIHIPDWRRRMDALHKGAGLPNIDDIRNLWKLFLEYTALQGQSIRFQGQVMRSDGSSVLRDIVSIGTFTAISQGKFLAYLPEVEQFTQLVRQPSSRYLASADKYFNATEGFVAAPLDPSRGGILSLLVSTPTLEERMRQGGWIGYFIVLIGGIGLLVGVWRIVALQKLSYKIHQQISHPEQPGDNPLARLFSVYQKNKQATIQALELKLDDAIIKELPGLERGLSLLKVFAVIAPLLGLLGTVTGMLETFQAITLFGTGDPKLMAGGISHALVTTAMGLIVAVPILLLHTYVLSKSRYIREILEEQGVGLMAEYADIKQS